MKDREYREGDRPENLLEDLGYETQDIDYPKIARSAVVFVLFFFGTAAAVIVMMWGGLFPTGLRGGQVERTTVRRLPEPGVPLLQTNITARTDIHDLRAEETQGLTAVGQNPATGTHRIPIDRAIDLLAERGLPKTPDRPDLTGAPRPGGLGGAMQGAHSQRATSPGGAGMGTPTTTRPGPATSVTPQGNAGGGGGG